jgi:hypothetical protein
VYGPQYRSSSDEYEYRSLMVSFLFKPRFAGRLARRVRYAAFG